MGAWLGHPAPPESEASLPTPGDEPICTGFDYPACIIAVHGHPGVLGPQTGPAGVLDPQLEPAEVLDPQSELVGVLDPQPEPVGVLDPQLGPAEVLDPQPEPAVVLDPQLGQVSAMLLVTPARAARCEFSSCDADAETSDCQSRLNPQDAQIPASDAALRRSGAESNVSTEHQYSEVPFCLANCLKTCDGCGSYIFCLFQAWLKCSDCKLKIHKNCKKLLKRECAVLTAIREPSYEMRICPERPRGLSAQKNKCAECSIRILPPQRRSAQGQMYKEGKVRKFKRCDYNGKYYCIVCIRHDKVPIPARVVSNWIWTPRLVSRASMQYLRIMHRKPVIDLESLNPQIFIHRNELGQARELRRELHVISKNFLSVCDAALQEGLLKAFDGRRHLLDSPDLYSMQDLKQVYTKALIKLLVKTNARCRTHIRAKCQTCRDKGQMCVLCQGGLLLFPFDRFVMTCARCGRLQHSHCYEMLGDREKKSIQGCRGCQGGQVSVPNTLCLTSAASQLTLVAEADDERDEHDTGEAADDTNLLATTTRYSPGSGTKMRVVRTCRTPPRRGGGGYAASPRSSRSGGGGSPRRFIQLKPPVPRAPTSDAWCGTMSTEWSQDGQLDQRGRWYNTP